MKEATQHTFTSHLWRLGFDYFLKGQTSISGMYIPSCCCLVTKSCPTCNPMNCIPSGSSVHGISQARILKLVAISFSRGSFRPRDWTQVSCIAADSLPAEPKGNPKNTEMGSLSLLQGSSRPRNWTRVSLITLDWTSKSRTCLSFF